MRMNLNPICRFTGNLISYLKCDFLGMDVTLVIPSLPIEFSRYSNLQQFQSGNTTFHRRHLPFCPNGHSEPVVYQKSAVKVIFEHSLFLNNLSVAVRYTNFIARQPSLLCSAFQFRIIPHFIIHSRRTKKSSNPCSSYRRSPYTCIYIISLLRHFCHLSSSSGIGYNTIPQRIRIRCVACPRPYA